MRKQEFIPDGKRIIIPAKDVVHLWTTHSQFDPRYALGTATHETDRTSNERDTEDSGFITEGMYQVSKEEKVHVGMPEANLLDPEECTIVFAKLTDERVQSLLAAADWVKQQKMGLPFGLNAYVFLAHNQGLAAAIKTIKAHGIDWEGYKSRNIAAARAAVAAAAAQGSKVDPTLQAKLDWWLKVASYGDACLTGGPDWSSSFLQLAVV